MSLMRTVAGLAAALCIAACSSGGPESEAQPEPGNATDIKDYMPGPASMRRLTQEQYISTIHGLFGSDIDVLPPTEVDTRVQGLLSVGASAAGITPAGLERYEASANQVASLVLAADRRERVLGCTPDSATAADDGCAMEFIVGLGPRVLRRGLREGEAEAYVALARASTQELGDFYAGLGSVLSSWLLSADFLFIQEAALPADPDEGITGRRLSAESLASRLSYFLWNSAPDDELLDAALAGTLDDDEGYRAQVARLIADDERLEDGIRSLFNDLYEFEALDSKPKDTSVFPQYTMGVVADAQEQTLRTIVEHLLVERADYRDLFTTRKTFMTEDLGPIYGVPVASEWEPFEFPAGGTRAGILSHVSFLALQARSVRSSPILRGRFVLDSLLCTPIPPPPAEVNFEALAPESGLGDTARERLAVHRADPNCAVCHDQMDPIGLALENFDAIGQFRTQENGVTIETFGEIGDVQYDDVTGFYPTLRNEPRLVSCMVLKLYMHATGRVPTVEENRVLDALEADFAALNYDFVSLMETIALTHGFRATSGPRQLEEEQ